MHDFQSLLESFLSRKSDLTLEDAQNKQTYLEFGAQVKTKALGLQSEFSIGQRFLLQARHDLHYLSDLLALLAAGMLAIPYPCGLPEEQVTILTKRFQAQKAPPLFPEGQGNLSPLDPQSLCLALLTSGSGGELKAAGFQAQALFWNALTVMQEQALASPGNMGIHLPLHHAFGLVTQMLPALISASPLILLERQLWPGDLLKKLQAHQIATFAAVPTTLRLMLQGSPPPLESLQHLSIAGAALHPEEIPALQRLFPQAEIWIGYGLTEAGPRVSAISSKAPDFHSGSAGFALKGVELRIENEELCVRSPSLMQGYLEAPELTQATLQAGWLRSGDKASLDAQGRLFIEGRCDDTLLCAGEKVAPLQVERILLQAPGILHVAVYGEPDPILGTRLIALLQAQNEGPSTNLHALKKFCRLHLEPHQIPSLFYSVTHLPLTTTGKLRRKELSQWPKTPWS